MDVHGTLGYILVGCLFGVIGQGIRAVVGIKKKIDKANHEDLTDWFNKKKLIFSLLIGAIAGGLGAVVMHDRELNRQFLLTIIAMGYAGTDFIEGFMKSRLSKYKL